MWADLLPRIDTELALLLHMQPPHIDIEDPALQDRSWHWLRDRILYVTGRKPTTPTP